MSRLITPMQNNAKTDKLLLQFEEPKEEIVKKISSIEYRDRIYIRKDIILKLAEYGELNQTTLLSHCGLNIVNAKDIFFGLESKGYIRRTEIPWGKKKITNYSATGKGLEIVKTILEPYEEIFPRKKK